MSKRIRKLIFKFTNWLIIALVISSCGNGKQEKQAVVLNDSTPADIRTINDQINSDRNNPGLYFQRAKAHYGHQDYENALADMQIALKIDSTKSDYYVYISDLYFIQNKSRDTRDALRKAISLDSSNTQALTKYSQLFFLMKTYDTAMFYINRSLHFNKANAVANFQKGMILKETADTAKAVSCFQSAVELNQEYFEAYMQLGILLGAKKNSLALGYFDNALRIKPKSLEAGYAKAKFLQDIGEYDKALTEYDSLLVISPENQDVTYNMGAILFEQKKYDDAMRKFDLTIKRDENFFRGYCGRGRCFEATGQKQKAIADYKKCLALKPDYMLAIQQLDIVERK